MEFIYKSHQQSAESSSDQTENDDALAAKTVGQRAAGEGAYKTGDGKRREQDSHLGHANIELLSDVQGEERE